jgi:hypothetical protein
MKKLFIVALLVVGMTSFAQEEKQDWKSQMEQMTQNKRNQLHLKKMTLELDLNASQQKKWVKIIAEQSTKERPEWKRKANKDSLKTTYFWWTFAKSQMLDEQIVMKEREWKILSADQYKKWDEMKGKTTTEWIKEWRIITAEKH